MFVRSIIIAGFLLFLSAGSVSAGMFQFDFAMDGLQEVPPNPSPATGTCQVLLDSGTGGVSASCTYANLLANVTAAHIHGPALPGFSAIPIITLSHTGGTSGLVTGNGVLNPAQVQDMIDGLHYVNVHSQFRPAGEIRGQVIPEPATAVLLGLGCLAVIRRRR